MLGLAKKLLGEVLETLRPQIRAGVPVVGLEPSCVSVFRDELVGLLHGDEDARRLKNQTFLFTEFFARKAPEYRPPRLARQALVHQHCHHKAVLDAASTAHVLDTLGLEYHMLDSGCCGMAGAFGFECGDHYDVSIEAGERILLPAVRKAEPEALIVADGFSCREQIAQRTSRQALHPAQVMKMALDDRYAGRHDAYPEQRYMADLRAEQRRAVAVGTALTAMLFAATAVAAVTGRRGHAR
jgi:Fe-S oxidoreductase